MSTPLEEAKNQFAETLFKDYKNFIPTQAVYLDIEGEMAINFFYFVIIFNKHFYKLFIVKLSTAKNLFNKEISYKDYLHPISSISKESSQSSTSNSSMSSPIASINSLYIFCSSNRIFNSSL